MKQIFLACVMGFCCWSGMALADNAVPTDTDPVAQKRAMELAAKLRCLVCQNQSIADSEADLANDLRRQVREQIAAGKTDEQIIKFMTDRYGDFVLYEPPMRASTVLLWIGPLLLLVAGATGMVFLLRGRGQEQAGAAALTPDEQERAEALLEGRTLPFPSGKGRK